MSLCMVCMNLRVSNKNVTFYSNREIWFSQHTTTFTKSNHVTRMDGCFHAERRKVSYVYFQPGCYDIILLMQISHTRSTLFEYLREHGHAVCVCVYKAHHVWCRWWHKCNLDSESVIINAHVRTLETQLYVRWQSECVEKWHRNDFCILQHLCEKFWSVLGGSKHGTVTSQHCWLPVAWWHLIMTWMVQWIGCEIVVCRQRERSIRIFNFATMWKFC